MTDRIVIPDNVLDELERTVELDAEHAFLGITHRNPHGRLITLPSDLVAELVRSYRAHLEAHIETHMAEHLALVCEHEQEGELKRTKEALGLTVRAVLSFLDWHDTIQKEQNTGAVYVSEDDLVLFRAIKEGISRQEDADA